MFRMWCKLFDDRGHLIKDTVIKNADPDLNRTRKIFAAIHDACYEFDLAEPIWLDSNVSDFQRHSKVRFTKDNFVEDIEFAYMEIEVIEEDQKHIDFLREEYQLSSAIYQFLCEEYQIRLIYCVYFLRFEKTFRFLTSNYSKNADFTRNPHFS